MNERKTENIVRKHFESFKDVNLIIEEQSSDNLRIQKLLNNASKSGNGIGKPDFIIQYKDNPNFIIVVECKASTRYHESENRDNFRDYAVDGVLLYGSFLSKEYDVLCIAVSGIEKDNLKISHFLYLKNDKKPIDKFSHKLLFPNNYLDEYIKSPEKFRQDYNNLRLVFKKINNDLHKYKIEEDNRALLISCILIALENSVFVSGYRNITNANQLCVFLLSQVKNEFENGRIGHEKLDILENRFNFIKTNQSLSKEQNILREIIEEVELGIKDFIRNHKYYDVLGELYIEFLRYANSDKGLGIVLTPPHITEFMAKLAETNKDSIVYDNCTGTGGFLVSAMRIMILDANNDNNKIKNIKSRQLFGVEFSDKIFSLACSNMFIHQDGKTGIFIGKSEDENIKEKIKKENPTVGLLNPPYNSSREELGFVLDNLECLSEGGKCVAILPMSVALETTGKIYELKEKLLRNHTLEGVLSMNSDLFSNSNVNVPTCIMIFTAKKPHPINKEVFFGYFKEDGFVKTKDLGRIDVSNNFKDIENIWLSTFMNRKIISGFSVTKKVSPKDEWCAEAYLDTDYSKIKDEMFINSIKKHSAFNILENDFYTPKTNSLVTKKIDLEDRKWSWFKYNDIFDIERGKTSREFSDNNILMIGASQNLNGSNGEHENIEPFYDGINRDLPCISVGNGGNTGCGQSFLQNLPFNAKGTVNILWLNKRFNIKLNSFIGIFLVSLIKLEKYRFGFGRGWSIDRMKESSIKLPIDKNGNPDWKFMEDYIKSLPYSSSL